jgi:GNAT superfamily N-acetyltransferase
MRDDTEIRYATAKDADKIWDFYIKAKTEQLQMQFPEKTKAEANKEALELEKTEKLKQNLKSKSQHWLIATLDNKITGIGSAYCNGESGWITMLYSKERETEINLARQILKWLKDKGAKYASISAYLRDAILTRTLKRLHFKSEFSEELYLDLASFKPEENVPMPFKVRKATPEDIGQIWDVFLEAKIDEQQLQFPKKNRAEIIRNSIKTKPEKIKEWKEDLSFNGSIWFVAEIDNKIVAFASATAGKIEGSLTNLYVVKDFRRKGIGSFLLQKRLQWLNEKGVKIVRTHAFYKNKPSLNNLKKTGFKTTHTMMYFKKLI